MTLPTDELEILSATPSHLGPAGHREWILLWTVLVEQRRNTTKMWPLVVAACEVRDWLQQINDAMNAPVRDATEPLPSKKAPSPLTKKSLAHPPITPPSPGKLSFTGKFGSLRLNPLVSEKTKAYGLLLSCYVQLGLKERPVMGPDKSAMQEPPAFQIRSYRESEVG